MRAPLVPLVLVSATILAGCERPEGGDETGPPDQPDAAETFEDLTARSVDYLRAKQTALQEDFGLGGYDRYDFDQETAQIVFSDGGVPRVIAETQVVGSYSPGAGTWRWSWANASVLEKTSKAVKKVRSYGEKHQFKRLMEDEWEASEEDAWEMTSIAACLLQAKGAYRAPGRTTNTFLILTEVRFAPTEDEDVPRSGE